MPSADDVVKFIIFLWFVFAFFAGLALFCDKLFVSFKPKFYYTTLFFLLTSIISTFFGLFSIYHKFYTLITHIHKQILLILCTILAIFLQIVLIDQIIPYKSNFKTKDLILHYKYPIWQTYSST